MDGLFEAAGTLRATYQAVDWAATPLGPVPGWSPTLRATVDVALHTRFPVALLWGPEFVLLYNEAYVELIGHKHPAALGRSARQVFAEVWDVVGPMLASVRSTRRATWTPDLRLLMDRRLRATGRRPDRGCRRQVGAPAQPRPATGDRRGTSAGGPRSAGRPPGRGR